jgi:hypothetical protein
VTPAADRPKNAPVPPAVKQQTVKQEREAQRQAKVAAFKQAQRRKNRNRRIGIWAAVVGGVAVVAVLVTSVVLTLPKNAIYPGGGTGTGQDIAGVELFQNTSEHVEGTVDYPQNPPAGGPHNQYWLNCGVYTEEQTNENAVHSLEHGAIWVTYDPSLSDAAPHHLRRPLTEVRPSRTDRAERLELAAQGQQRERQPHRRLLRGVLEEQQRPGAGRRLHGRDRRPRQGLSR